MFSSTSLIIFGIVALVAIAVIWKWWKTPKDGAKPEQPVALVANATDMAIADSAPPPQPTEPPPMVFAVNDSGNLDLTDMSGKILNIGYGPHPKTYIGLLDQAEKDTTRVETERGVIFTSNVGNTKLYQAAGRPYIINYTRL
jgi:hypothetical protein